MAYNEISLPTWQNLVRRIFGLTGQGGNVPQLAPEIQPVVILQPDNPEYRFLRGETLWAGGQANVASAAGTIAASGIVNPGDSGKVVVFTRLRASFLNPVQQTNAIRIDTQANVEAQCPNIPGTSQAGPRDTRLIVPGGGIPAAVVRNGQPAVILGFPLVQQLQNQTSATTFGQHELDLRDVVLFPGFGVYAHCGNTGVGSNVGLMAEWFERAIDRSESNA